MDRYELKEELGDGSFGRVMKARHKKTDDVVSKKTLICTHDITRTWKIHAFDSRCTYPIVVRIFLFPGRNQAYQTQAKVVECDCGFTRSTKLKKVVPSQHRKNDGSNPREV
jgi:serine/threonine protein kinase